MEKQYRYTVVLNEFVKGSGYSYSEDFDEGESDELFTAREWLEMLDDPIEVDTDNGWTEVVLTFYDKDGNEVKRSYVNKTTW